MEVLTLLLWLSLGVVVLALIGYVWSVAQGMYDHADRLTLLPLDNEEHVKAKELRIANKG